MKVIVPTFKEIIARVPVGFFTRLIDSIEDYNKISLNKEDVYDVSKMIERQLWHVNHLMLSRDFTRNNKAFKLDRYYKNNSAQYSLVANAPVARVVLDALYSQAVWGPEDSQIIC